MTESGKKGHDNDSMDFNKLEKELYAAVEQDKRYWRENDAKFRAVHQKVASYEEFRDIVLASHIKPLQKGDTLENITFDVKWNSHADTYKDKAHTNILEDIKKSSNLPKDNLEFVRDWRRHCKSKDDQYKFLLDIGGQQLGRIFRTDIDLLGDFLLVLESEFKNTDSVKIIEILENFCAAKRFSLSVQFLGGKEKKARDSLFEKLECTDNDEITNTANRERVDKLKSSYGVNTT